MDQLYMRLNTLIDTTLSKRILDRALRATTKRAVRDYRRLLTPDEINEASWWALDYWCKSNLGPDVETNDPRILRVVRIIEDGTGQAIYR